jgi:hypothetical protein
LKIGAVCREKKRKIAEEKDEEKKVIKEMCEKSSGECVKS